MRETQRHDRSGHRRAEGTRLAVQLRGHVHAWRGEVKLTGRAPSLQEHDRALATVWSVPGVASVLDELSIDDPENSD
ncbi:MAG: BON domain-containing protein [Solirubrobacteraceae bacterium]